MTSKSDKVDKIVARLQARIAEGQFYEAQQQARVVAARHARARNFPAAVDILASVAQSLLRAGQGGSAGDLCVALVEAYRQAETPPGPESRDRLLACLRLFDPQEPTRKKFIAEMISWSAKFGDCPAGDPELHHVIGTLFAAERSPYDAEPHLILGTRDSSAVLARLEYAWYKENAATTSHLAAQYAARAVLPSMLLGNLRGATEALRVFTGLLAEDNPDIGAQDVASARSDARVFPSLPLLNFLGLLVLAAQRGTRDVFAQLLDRYKGHLAAMTQEDGDGSGGGRGGWEEPLQIIAEMYFGIARPRRSNPLMDMMGSLFGGGGGGGAMAGAMAGARALAGARRGGGNVPAPEGLD